MTGNTRNNIMQHSTLNVERRLMLKIENKGTKNSDFDFSPFIANSFAFNAGFRFHTKLLSQKIEIYIAWQILRSGNSFFLMKT